MNETQALNDLHSLLNKYERMKHSRRHELETDIQLFESWINSGHQGVFPLDLDKWGITGDLVETTPKTGSALRQPGSLPFIPGQERPDSGSSLMEPQNLPTQTDHSAGLEHRDAMIADPESEATARLWLDEARKDISDGADIEHLKEAVQLCDEVLSSPAEDMHSEAGQVRAQALTSLGRLVDKELEEGQLAQKRGDEKAARAAYQRALLIESENESAKNALLSLDQADVRAFSRQDIQDLRKGLAERNSLAILETTIRRCEADVTLGIDLPDELKQLLPDARKYFDKVREMDGIVISQIRGGNLSESKKAVDYFQNLMISERKDYFDPMTGRLAPLTPDVLLEANKIWLQRSEELVQDILQKIKPYLPGKPRTAKGILENGHLEKDETGKLVRRPYHVQSERLLENKELEVDEQLSRLIDAESLVAQAEASNDPIDVFKQLQKARDVFEYMEGIGARIENARQTALQHLMARIEETYASARTALKLLKFDEARAKVGEADQMGAHWASQPVPTDLTEKLHTSQALRESIDALEKDRNDFEKIVAEIRKLKEDELKHPEAFRLLDSLAAEERFQVFSGEFHRINHDMDSLRGIADQLSTARLARSLADWQRVWNIASENKSHAGLDRDLREQFEKLFLEADMELRVIEAREFIEKGDIPKANNILSRLVHSSHPFHQEVSQRLAAEIAHIKEVIQQNPPWNTLFETALAEARKPGFEQQFAALHMLRYISGDIKEARLKGWPEYRLSLRTADAAREAQHLALRLRENALKDVQAAYQSRQDPVGEARIRYLAEIAEGLRQAYLLESREEREAAQWVEIEKARLEHEDYARLDDWDAAVSLWEDLDRHYPRMAIVQTYLQTAHIQQALLRADTALREDKGQDALNILWEAQRDFTLSRSCELNLKLAEVYANREDFSRAYEILTSLESSDKCAKDASQKIAQFQKEEQILGFLHQAEAENNKEHYPEALKILLEDAPKNQLVEDDKRLVDLAMIIFSKRSQVLSEMIETQNKIGTYSAKVNALNAALELRLLENSLKVKREVSRALKAIEALRAELPQIALNLMQEVNRYDLNNISLATALEDTRNSVQRLEAFNRIKQQYNEELDGQSEALKMALQKAVTRLSNLTSLEKQVPKIDDPTLWKAALIKNDFSVLDSIDSLADNLNLSGLVEIQAFIEKLNEFRALSPHFEKACATVREDFITNEDFEKVIRDVTRLKSRPETYKPVNKETRKPENKDVPFHQVGQEEYDLVYQMVGGHFKLVDLYSENNTNLNGWQTIIQTSVQRHSDYTSWKTWSDAVRACELQARSDYAALDQLLKTTLLTLNQKLQGWEKLLIVMERGLQTASQLPARSDATLPIQSEKAENEKKAGLASAANLGQQKKWAEVQIKNIVNESAGLGGFPSAEEFKKLAEANDLEKMARRIKQAKEIGPSSLEEEKRIRMYELKIYSAEPERPGFWGWLNNLFGGR